jgi:glycosyltransferase involved in cell wall biosynthesis
MAALIVETNDHAIEDRTPVRPRAIPSARILSEFDTEFYLAFYADVEVSGTDALEHYLAFGFDERRYPNAAWFWADVEAVEQSGVLDQDDDERDAPTRLQQMLYGIEPTPTFDTGFVAVYYHRTISAGENVFAFYCRHAHRSWCMDHHAAGAAMFDRVRNSPMFNAAFVREKIVEHYQYVDPASYYCTEGFRIPIDPSRLFSSRGYLAEYSDIAAVQINPLIHFSENGSAEGRRAATPRETAVLTGERAFQKDLPTLLICSHEASRSGAPLVGLNLARQLADRANVVSVLLRGGVLADDFKALSQSVVVTGDQPRQMVGALDHVIDRFKPAAAILNSVETTKLLTALVARDVPVVSLVHEFAQYVYPFDVVSQAIALSHQVIFPCNLVKNAALRELAQLGISPTSPRNIAIRPQGRPVLPPTKVSAAPLPAILRPDLKKRPLVVGAGWVQPRKGVDLFIETARVLKHDLKIEADFVWVGGNYAPRQDMLTAAYLADQIEASGLVDNVHFVEEQSNLAPVWAVADVFFMSSRLDPYPNVALDAVAEGLPVVCFDRGTGIADLGERWPDRVAVAPYNDTRKAATLIADYFERGRFVDESGLPRELQYALSFSDYADDMLQYVESAIARQANESQLVEGLQAPGNLDAMVFHADLPPWLATNGDLTASAGGLAKLAVRTALNGLPIGRIRRQRQGHLSAEFQADETDPAASWEHDDAMLEGRSTSSEGRQKVQPPFSAVLITEDLGAIDRFYELALRRPKVGPLAIISDLISPSDIAASSSGAMDHVLVLGRSAESWMALQAKLGDGPVLLMDDVPALNTGADWIAPLWSEVSVARASDLIFLRRLGGVERGPWLKAMPERGATDADTIITRRSLESSLVGASGLTDEMAKLIKALLTSKASIDLWEGLSLAGVDRQKNWKVVAAVQGPSARPYDLVYGRTAIKDASAEAVSRRALPIDRLAPSRTDLKAVEIDG